MNRSQKACIVLLSTSLSFGLFSTSVFGEYDNTSYSYIVQKDIVPESIAKSISVDIAPVTRETLWSAILYALEKEETNEQYELPFSDSDDIEVAYRYSAGRCYSLGILTGSQEINGLFANPKSIVTNEEAAVMLGKAFGLSSTSAPNCNDAEDISQWAVPYVSALLQSNMIQNDANGMFRPEGVFTNRSLWIALQKADESFKLKPPSISVLADGNSKTSAFSMPTGITVDSLGNYYFAATGNSQVFMGSASTTASIYAGSESPKDLYQIAVGGYLDAYLTKAAFCQPSDVLSTAEGLIVADAGNHTVRMIKDNQVYTFAGTGVTGHRDGNLFEAQFDAPTALASDDLGNIYISDSKNHCIRKIDTDGKVSTVAGTPTVAGYKDGNCESAQLCYPNGLAFQNGSLYIADTGNQRIRVLKDGMLTTLAGGGEEQYENTPLYMGDWQDGNIENARFHDPVRLAFDQNGNLLITDSGNSMIRRYKDGFVDTIYGGENSIATKDKNTDDLMLEPWGIAILNGQIIITDRFTNQILTLTYS